MKLHHWDPINYEQFNRYVLGDRQLFPTIADCSHLAEGDEIYHMCETEIEGEEYLYEFIQCYKCITRHFVKFHRKFLRDSIYAQMIDDFFPKLLGQDEA